MLLPVASAACAAAAVASAYLSPQLLRYRQTAFIRQRILADRLLALTYDDGPSVESTPAILDLLATHSAKATFFAVGRQAASHPEILDRATREGHEIACHTQDHLNAWKTTPWAAARDVQRGYQNLSRWCPPNGSFRPPFGKMTLSTWLAVRRHHATPWWWTVDSGDSSADVPPVGSVIEQVARDGGGVVLMHDLDYPDRRRRQFVYQTTDALLKLALRESIRICRLRDL